MTAVRLRTTDSNAWLDSFQSARFLAVPKAGPGLIEARVVADIGKRLAHGLLMRRASR